ncbi:MAG TPA: SRPBCC domain-containing protein [Jatrophihabitans sp.]|jgi:uncharacterized protein YndB with AHSA1/START domain
MGKEFELRREVQLPGTPEQVWAAIATERGVASWLWPMDIEPREGGAVSEGGVVTVWDPPHRFANRAEREDGWFNALEFIVEAHDGGGAVLRCVHSGIFDEDWDAQYDGANQGWNFYLHTLAQYLQYFPGQAATYIGADAPPSSADPAAWPALQRELGLADDVEPGASVRFSLDDSTRIEGELDYLTHNLLGIRTSDALYRFHSRWSLGMPLGVGHHLFADDVDRDETRSSWQAFLNRVTI